MGRLRHFIQPQDFTIEEFESLFRLANDILSNPSNYSHCCDGKILASLFFEPSTRTRLSFETAMNRLGGRVIGFADPAASSTTKGESLGDTLRTVEGYADIGVIRHPKEGAAHLATKYLTTMPIINAGDGGHQHPTQTLTDLITIRRFHQRLEGLKIGFCGDLKFGRTVHSLIRALKRYPNNQFVLISPEELQLPEYMQNEIKETNYCEEEDLSEVIEDLDILYMTRVQKERFVSEAEYERLKDFYILNEEKMKLAKEDMIVMHPLPRVNEISQDLDSDPRCVYFKQAKLGMYGRMALIMKLLEVEI
ncbi:MAG: aspartate carbamoyltransferase [Tissierellia bacterium]|nr:aspartate carbamoyltransferase [Tissierellia bacterium]